MVNFEKEVCAYLALPNIPKKEWDNKTPFDKGVAVIVTQTGREEYAVATYKDDKPNINKVFGVEPFVGIKKIFVVPDYMEKDVKNADLDDASKEKAEELIKEAEEIENEGTEETNNMLPDLNENPFIFDFIHNDEEAVAYIKAYNEKNKIAGRVPQNHDSILARLAVIYAETNKQANE